MSDDDYVNGEEAAGLFEQMDQTMAGLRALVGDVRFADVIASVAKLVQQHDERDARSMLEFEVACWHVEATMAATAFDVPGREPTPEEWEAWLTTSRFDTQDIKTDIVRYRERYGRGDWLPHFIARDFEDEADE